AFDDKFVTVVDASNKSRAWTSESSRSHATLLQTQAISAHLSSLANLRSIKPINASHKTKCLSKGHFNNSDDKTVEVWDLATQSVVKTLVGHTKNVSVVADLAAAAAAGGVASRATQAARL
ncbi:hypothetical protein Gpo141_00012985, partial [Globisporangium polare]